MNKKNIYASITVFAISAMAAFNVNVNTQDNVISDLSLANVEALASETSEEFLKATGCIAVWEVSNCNGYSYAKKP